MVGFAGNATTAPSSNCLATVRGWASREKAEGNGDGVVHGVEIAGDMLVGDESMGESDILLWRD